MANEQKHIDPTNIHITIGSAIKKQIQDCTGNMNEFIVEAIKEKLTHYKPRQFDEMPADLGNFDEEPAF